MKKRYFYKDNNGNKYSYKQPHEGLTPITEDEFYKSSIPLNFEKLHKLEKINELKSELWHSDYKVLKYIEGKLTNLEFAQISTERQKLRDEINALEKEVEKYE